MQPKASFDAFQLAIGPSDEAIVLPFGHAPRMLYVRPRRHCTRDDFAPLMRRIVEDTDLRPDLPTLWDLRGHDFADFTAESCRMLAYAMGRYSERRNVRRGFLVDSEHGFGSGRMFEQTVGGYNLDNQGSFLVSYSAEEIIDWLAGMQ